MYAIAACGLVLTYTTSGIFNFAHGAIGMMAAFTYWQFNTGWGWGAVPSLVMVIVVIAPLFGAVVERFVIRGLEGTSEAVRIVVTVSLLLALLGLANVIWPNEVARFNQDFFPNRSVRIFAVNVSYHRLIILGTACFVAFALRLMLYRTRIGISMRAVVDDRSLVQLNGGRPYRSSMMAWSIGASLAAISGVLVSSQFGLKSLDLTLLIVNAFAAAAIGRLKSLPKAFLGALILGLTEAYATGYLAGGREIWGFQLDNIRFAISPLLLFAVMVIQPQERLRTGGVQRVREYFPVPTMRSAYIGAVVFVVAALGISQLVIADTELIPVIPALYFALIALSLVPLTGWAGSVSLGQLSFAGLGGVMMAVVGVHATTAGLLVAVAVCGAVGALVALPALRLNGIYLALATAAFAMVMSRVVFNQPKVMPGGNRQVPPLDLGFVKVDTNAKQVVALAIAIAVIGVGLVGLRRSGFGRRLTAMKDSPVACATLGLSLTRTKITVFALSAAIAGLGGALFSRTILSSQFELPESMALTMLAVVGGIGAVSGAVFGGLLFGGFATIFPTVFATNAIGLFRFAEISVPDLAQITPGLAGISLGKNPNGAVSQITAAYGAVGRSRTSVSIALGVPVLLWILARSGTITNWTFVATMFVFLFAVLPLVPILVSPIPGGRMLPAAIWLGVVLVGTGAIDWGTAIGSNGMKFVVMGLTTAVSARVAIIAHGAVPAIPGAVAEPSPSPDMVGVDRPLTRSDVLDADLALGIDEGMLDGVA